MRNDFVRVNQRLLTAQTTTTTGASFPMCEPPCTFEATVTGTGAVTATVVIEATNLGSIFYTLGTITLSGTTSAGDAFAVTGARYEVVRARITAISGTGASVDCTMVA